MYDSLYVHVPCTSNFISVAACHRIPRFSAQRFFFFFFLDVRLFNNMYIKRIR